MSQSGAEIVDDEVEEVVVPEPDNSAIEREARRSGWVPKDEFRGRPELWKDAETFVRKGQEILPIMRQDLAQSRAETERLRREVGDLKRNQTEQQQTMQELLTMARSSESRGFERAKREIEGRQREAAISGDVAAFDEAATALRELEREAPKVPEPKPRLETPPPVADVAPEVGVWARENPWFGKDRALSAYMEDQHVRLLAEAPGLTLTENLERAKAATMRKFPEKFGLEIQPEEIPLDDPPRQQRRTPVSPPTEPPAPRGADPLKIDSIQDTQERAQARAAFERQRRQIEGFTEADYMRLYNNPRLEGHNFATGRRA